MQETRTGLIPGLGPSHMPLKSEALESQLLSVHALEPVQREALHWKEA